MDIENHVFTVAILGCGNRGAETYGRLLSQDTDHFRITTLCDTDREKLSKYGRKFSVEQENLFLDEAEFLERKRADLLVIATMDRDHVRECLAALRLGYDVLLEKPVTARRDECESLLRAQRESGRKVIVCHVLRYGAGFRKVKELLDRGTCGKLVAIQALEQVGYWHQAHSFVRGNWRNQEDTAPTILAKCCHDLDLLQYYAQSRCESVSSVGGLAYFKAENAPKCATERCLDCPLSTDCAYSAKRIYVAGWEKRGKPARIWPQYQITDEYPLTEAALYRALRQGPYGRCVFKCDNDAFDHQSVLMTFENGVQATLNMMAFTDDVGREIKFFCTEGEIKLDEKKNFVYVNIFDQRSYKIKISVTEDGHGGGDEGLINCLYPILMGREAGETSLEESIESHLMGICAEESRRNGGRLVYVHENG